MTLLSAQEKFASLFNFLKFLAAKGGCFPLSTKYSLEEFFNPLQKSPGGLIILE